MNPSPNEERYPSKGFVRQIPHKEPSSTIEVPAHKNTVERHVLFSENTARVFRQPHLAAKALAPANPKVSIFQALLIRAHSHIRGFFHGDHDRKGLNCTIIDGTAWADAIHAPGWDQGILSINILWDNYQPYVSIHVGYRRTIVNYTCYRINSSNGGMVVTYPYHHMEEPEQTVQRLFEAGKGCSSLAELKLWEKMYKQAFVECFDDAIEYPVAAATLLDGSIWYAPRPGRHFHIEHSDEFRAAANVRKERELQGFLTNHGNFINRYRSMYQAFLMRQVIGAEGMEMKILRCNDKLIHPADPRLTGTIQSGDRDPKGYQICATPLFSEDVW